MTLLGLGMHFFGLDLNWWETLLVILLCPGWLAALGFFWDQ